MTDTTLRRMRPWLGTYVSIEACAADATRAALAVDNAFAEIATLHAAMSFHSASSELACLHREAHLRPTRIGWHTWAVLAQALQLARLSAGVFDPTFKASLGLGTDDHLIGFICLGTANGPGKPGPTAQQSVEEGLAATVREWSP